MTWSKLVVVGLMAVCLCGLIEIRTEHGCATNGDSFPGQAKGGGAIGALRALAGKDLALDTPPLPQERTEGS